MLGHCAQRQGEGKKLKKVEGFPQLEIPGSENSRSAAEQEGEAGPSYSE